MLETDYIQDHEPIAANGNSAIMTYNENTTSRRESILREAACLFREKGYAGSTLRELAKRVGIKGGSIYHHFQSKQEILFNIMEYTMTSLIVKVREAVGREQDPFEKLRVSMKIHIEYHTVDTDETYVTDSELRSLEAPNYSVIIGLRNRYEAIYREILREGVERGLLKIGNVTIASRALLQMCTGVSHWYNPDGELSIEEITNSYVELFCWGVVGDRRNDNDTVYRRS